MKRTNDAENLAKKWEGYHTAQPDGSARAYLDPVGIPTIGWGTVYYTSAGLRKYGRNKCIIGDTLTAAQCEEEFDSKMDSNQAELNAMLQVPVTQSMFDALMCFAFNLGIEGTRLQINRCNAGLFKECADKFLEYINGDGRVWPGLVNRRKEERDLFIKDGLKPPSEIPFSPTTVTWVNLVRHEKEGQEPESRLYAMNGSICVEYSRFDLRANLIKELAKYPDANNVNVGKLNWHVEPEKKEKNAVPVMGGDAFLTKTSEKWNTGLWRGLQILRLQIGDVAFDVASGQPNAQVFRRPEHPRSFPGNMEPIPQGKYRIENILFANGKDNYSGEHGPGLGPVWVGLTANFSDDRGAFGFHLDSNISTSRGSAGCVVFKTMSDLKLFIAALRKFDPAYLIVDWGL